MRPADVSGLLAYGKALLKERGVESYALDAGLLLMEAAGLTRSELYVNGGRPVSGGETARYEDLLRLRAEHMPVQYILKRGEFMSLDFYVDKGVLIPRPDTEILAERAIALVNEGGVVNVLELCTGSGCVAVALAHYCRDVHVTATDLSGQALEVAEANAKANGVARRITFVLSDLFANVTPPAGGFDMLVCNPPYIPEAVIDTLSPSVRNFEPRAALSGGQDGLCFYRAIAGQCGPFLSRGAPVLFEIGCDQGESVSRILWGDGFTQTDVLKDLAGLDRVVSGRATVFESSL